LLRGSWYLAEQGHVSISAHEKISIYQPHTKVTVVAMANVAISTGSACGGGGDDVACVAAAWDVGTVAARGRRLDYTPTSVR
jgi:cysteine sulfinate desulfinase/cysteine desulfurase-like protein